MALKNFNYKHRACLMPLIYSFAKKFLKMFAMKLLEGPKKRETIFAKEY